MKYRLSLLLLSCALIISGCKGVHTKEPLSKSGVFFDTIISIKLFDTKDPKLLDECFSMCKEYENKFSRTIPTSEISKINASKGETVTVSDETIELLNKGLHYSRVSGGAFDITIAPLSTLWDFKNNTGVIPDSTQIAEAKSHVNYENIIIENNTVRLTDPKSAIDLGGIAKGYIADQLKEFLTENGVEHAIISLGGNILTIGDKTDGSPFRVGVQKPFAQQNEFITTVSVKDKSVVSSGIYERYFKQNNTIYHHILDPKTGFPYQNNLLEVTIISDSSADGDALSTTCFALGLEKGLEFINQLEGTEAVFITDDYQLHYSKNLKKVQSN